MKQIEFRDKSPINTAQLKAIRPTRLRRLLETSTNLSSTLDHNQLVEIVVTSASDLTESESASLYRVEQTLKKIELSASTAKNLSDAERKPSLDNSLYGWILGNKQPLVLQNVQEELLEYSEINTLDYSNADSLMAVPLLTKESVIGVLLVKNKLGDGGFTEQDSVLLQMLASHAAAALENVRLFQQTDLIADFMHEFKTPLMALTTASEILAREDLIPFHQELLMMIQSETARLSRMAQDFLDLSRLESGRLQFDQQPVDLTVVTEDVVKLQMAQADKKDIHISIEVLGDVPLVFGDYDRLKQLLLNLTNNAIKYNRRGGLVKIRLHNLGQEVAIKVMDTGPGIAAENVPHLFERFYRVRDDEGFTEGAGLGLPIAKRIVENHGGRIEVSSMLGGGSTFTCYLPLFNNIENTLVPK
jgi:signal transduction histidine kinase